MKTLPVLAACAALLATGACGGDSAEPEAAAPTSQTPTGGPGEATCDIDASTTATLTSTEDTMTVTVEGAQPDDGSLVVLNVIALGPYGEGPDTGGTVTIRYDQGELTQFSALSDAEVGDEPLDGAPDVTGDGITATVPLAAVGGLDADGIAYWGADLQVDDTRTSCLEGGSTLPFPG